MQIHAEHNDTMKTSDTVLKKYTSHFIWKVAKTLLTVLLWEGVGDRTEMQHIDPHCISHNRVSFSFSWAAQSQAQGPTPLDAGFLYPILSPTGLQTHWLSVLTELYNGSSAQSISLEWHVWLSSSGNNCHPVTRSISSGASVYDCSMGFYLVPYCQPSPPTRFLP